MLREATEKAKLQFSSTTHETVPFFTVDASGSKQLYMTLTKSKFESLVNLLDDCTKQPCKNCLKDTTRQVDEVLLVGGTSRVPKVQEKAEELFGMSSSEGANPILDAIRHHRTLRGVFAGLINSNTVVSAKNRVLSSNAANKNQAGFKDLQGEHGGGFESGSPGCHEG